MKKLILLFLLWPSLAFGGWSLTTSADSGGGGSVNVNVTAGDLIIGCASSTSGNSDTPSAITDNFKQVYTKYSIASDRPSEQTVFWAISSGSASPNNIALTMSNLETFHVAVFQHTGGNSAGIDDHQAASATGSVNVTASVADDLLFSCSDSSGTTTPGTGFTQLFQDASTVRLMTQYKLSGVSSGTVAVSYTGSPARSIDAVAFKPPSAGGTIFPRRRVMSSQ